MTTTHLATDITPLLPRTGKPYGLDLGEELSPGEKICPVAINGVSKCHDHRGVGAAGLGKGAGTGVADDFQGGFQATGQRELVAPHASDLLTEDESVRHSIEIRHDGFTASLRNRHRCHSDPRPGRSGSCEGRTFGGTCSRPQRQ